jgi:hypothetical protein
LSKIGQEGWESGQEFIKESVYLRARKIKKQDSLVACPVEAVRFLYIVNLNRSMHVYRS